MPGTNNPMSYEGKRALVVGGATGMGAATAQLVHDLGGEVAMLDVSPVNAWDQSAIADLRDRDAIDAALAELGGGIDAVFSCAGVADGTPGLMTINFIAHRYIIEKLTADGTLRRGGAVALISSTAGLGWRKNQAQIEEFLAREGWDDATAWVDANPETNSYMFSKQAINLYVTRESFEFIKGGRRINAVMPGPTVTPLAEANADLWLTYASDFRADAGLDPLSPEDIASPLAFLCSGAASGVNGELLQVDHGHTNTALAGGYHAPIVAMLAGEAEFDVSALGLE